MQCLKTERSLHVAQRHPVIHHRSPRMGGKTDFITVFLRDLDRSCTETAARPDDRPGCFVEMLLDPLGQLPADGFDILHVCLSSGISGSYNSACIASEQLREDYPDRKIYVLDSLGASSGYGLLMDELAEKKAGGMDIDSLFSLAEKKRLNVHHWFFSTDLTFYIRGGRISKTSGMIGTLLNICPLLNMDNLGRLVPRYKIRTKKKVIRTIVDKMEEHAEGGREYSGKCYISQSACIDDAREVARLVEERFPKLNGRVEINDIGTTIGSHTGPGTVALFFWGDERKD